MNNFETGGDNYEVEDSGVDDSMTQNERMEEVFESNDTMDLGILYVAGSERAAHVTIPDSDGEIRWSSVRISKRIRASGGVDYIYSEGESRRNATEDEINLFERVASRGFEAESQENEPRLTGSGTQTMRLGEYTVTSPMYPTPNNYPVVQNLRTGERIGFRSTYGRVAEYLEPRPRILVRRRREDIAENNRRERESERSFDWRSLVTLPRGTEHIRGVDDFMSEDNVQARLANPQEQEDPYDPNHYHDQNIYSQQWAEPGYLPPRARASNAEEYQEYMRVVRAAGLEEHLPPGIEE